MLGGDRYEILSAAIAASYMNIILAHIEGGDISGNIDESVRHAVTKLSHIHFCSNEESARRVLQMGESPKSIFNVGCPEIEELLINEERVNSEEINNLGVGDYININKSFLIVLFHPVTTDKDNRYHTSLLLDSVRETNYQTIWFWPNADAGTGDVAKAIRVFRERKSSSNMRFLKYLPVSKFLSLLRQCSCLVGNSSAGIKECSFLGIPVVNVGSRQNGRMRSSNVFDSPFEKNQIKSAIDHQIKKGSYPKSDIYFKENCGENIANILSDINVSSQKIFHDYGVLHD